MKAYGDANLRPEGIASAIREKDRAVRLFCLPHAGAGASVYARWPSAFGKSVEVHAIQLSGRENRICEVPVINPHSIATEILQAAEGPYALFGHSMGARLGFEVVRRLRTAGATLPEVLYVSGCRAPHVEGDGLLEGLSRVDDDELVARLCAAGGLPDQVACEPELLELLLPALRADFTWLDDYTYVESEPLPVPIVCFTGDRDQAAPVEEMRGWEHHTNTRFTLHVLPGGHFFVRDQLPELVRRIEASLHETTRVEDTDGNRHVSALHLQVSDHG